MSQDHKNIQYCGYSSADDGSIGGSNISGLKFLEWTEKDSSQFGFFDFVYDGFIGLAPPWRNDSGLPSLLTQLDHMGDLDARMFSLELNTTHNGTGTLVIGAKDELLEKADTVKLPVVDDLERDIKDMWTTPIRSLSIQSDALPPNELPFPGNSMAVLDPGTFQIILPRQYGIDLLQLLGAQRFLWVNAVPCPLVNNLPDLLFTFNEGQRVRITPEEYVLRIVLGYGVFLCTIAIDDAIEHPNLPDNTVVLGSSFLRGFHSIWDWGNRTIACE
jgi:hypothetical protein